MRTLWWWQEPQQNCGSLPVLPLSFLLIPCFLSEKQGECCILQWCLWKQVPCQNPLMPPCAFLTLINSTFWKGSDGAATCHHLSPLLNGKHWTQMPNYGRQSSRSGIWLPGKPFQRAVWGVLPCLWICHVYLTPWPPWLASPDSCQFLSVHL